MPFDPDKFKSTVTMEELCAKVQSFIPPKGVGWCFNATSPFATVDLIEETGK